MLPPLVTMRGDEAPVRRGAEGDGRGRGTLREAAVPSSDRVTEPVHRARTVWTMVGTRLALVCSGDEGLITVLVSLVFAVKTTFGFRGPKTKSKESEAPV